MQTAIRPKKGTELDLVIEKFADRGKSLARHEGYVVFVDDGADLERTKAGESVLRSHAGVDRGVMLRVANGATYFTYAPSGLGLQAAGSPALSQVVICDERGNADGPSGGSTARLFVSTPLGRATIVRDKVMIDGALEDMGATCP